VTSDWVNLTVGHRLACGGRALSVVLSLDGTLRGAVAELSGVAEQIRLASRRR